MNGARRTPTYSPSRLSTYEKCRLQYRYRYIDRIRRDVQGIEAFLGNRVHEALEKLYRDLQMERVPTVEDLTALYHRSWEKHYGENIRIVRTEYTADHYRKVGERCIRDFYRTYHPFRDGVTLGLEEKVAIPLEESGRYRVEGYVDRIARVAPGVYEIHDYKTGGSLPREEDLRTDRQLGLYQLGVQQRFPDAAEVHLVWHYLAFNQELRSERSPGALEDLKRRTVGLIQQIESTADFPPTESALCRWCEYLDICPLWKQRVRAATMPENEFLNEPSVRLVDRLAELDGLRASAEGEIARVREAILALCDREGVSVLTGTHHEVRVEEQVAAARFPGPGESGRAGLEMVLRELGQFDRFASLDGEALSAALDDPETDRYLRAALEKFARPGKTRRIRLIPKGIRQLNLFE